MQYEFDSDNPFYNDEPRDFGGIYGDERGYFGLTITDDPAEWSEISDTTDQDRESIIAAKRLVRDATSTDAAFAALTTWWETVLSDEHPLDVEGSHKAVRGLVNACVNRVSDLEPHAITEAMYCVQDMVEEAGCSSWATVAAAIHDGLRTARKAAFQRIKDAEAAEEAAFEQLLADEAALPSVGVDPKAEMRTGAATKVARITVQLGGKTRVIERPAAEVPGLVAALTSRRTSLRPPKVENLDEVARTEVKIEVGGVVVNAIAANIPGLTKELRAQRKSHRRNKNNHQGSTKGNRSRRRTPKRSAA